MWLGQHPGLAQVNLAIYDNLISLDAYEPLPDILLIGSDAHSLSELDPWPWTWSACAAVGASGDIAKLVTCADLNHPAALLISLRE